MCFVFVGGLQALGGIPSFVLMKFYIECNQNHVWGPPGARVMSIFVKICIFAREVLGEIHG